MTIECIAPSGAHSGWDLASRALAEVLLELGEIDAPMNVTNMVGAGGGLAFNHVVNERQTDGNLIVAASQATATMLAQGGYGDHTPNDVRFVGAIAADVGVVAVPDDSPFETLGDLVDAVMADASAVTITGGSTLGGFDHLKVLMILQDAGLEDLSALNYRCIEDAAADAPQVISCDLSEAAGSGLRLLATLSEDRLAGFEDTPTAIEQGFDVVAVNWRGFYVPKGISDEAFAIWCDRLNTVAQSDQWQAVMRRSGMLPFTKVGDDFKPWIEGAVATTKELSRALGILS